MKNFMMNKMKTSLLAMIAVTALLSACQKSGGGGAAPAPVPVPCGYQGCTGIVGAGGTAVGYGGNIAQNMMGIQGSFQVTGTSNSGYNTGYDTGANTNTCYDTNRDGMCDNYQQTPAPAPVPTGSCQDFNNDGYCD